MTTSAAPPANPAPPGSAAALVRLPAGEPWAREPAPSALPGAGALESKPPRPATVALDEAIGAIEDVERMIHALTGWRAVLLEAASALVPAAEAELLRPASDAARSPLSDRDADLAQRAFVADVACALRLPEQTVTGLVEEARTLVRDLPGTLVGLRAGAFSYAHARVVVDQTSDLDAAARAAVEAATLPRAATSTVAALRRHARRARERVHPEPPALRRRKAAEKRCVHLDPAADGMAWLSALLPAADGHAIMDRLDASARHLVGADEPRSVPQLRADVLCALLLDDGAGARALTAVARPHATAPPDETAATCESAATGDAASTRSTPPTNRTPTRPTPTNRTTATDNSSADNSSTRAALARTARGIVPRVSVTVPVLTLLGEDVPAELDGYGPIDPETARRLASDAPSLTRILTHPETGAVLSVGRDQYAVPADLRRWLVVRDGTCRFPGCGRRAVGCDVDHVTAFVDGGATEAANLAHLCRRHHRLKHETSWRVAPEHDTDTGTCDTLRWTSPTGRVHLDEPEVTRDSPPPAPDLAGATPRSARPFPPEHARVPASHGPPPF